MGHRFELVVDEELGRHENEAKGVDTANEGRQHKGVPALVSVVDERVDGIAEDERVEGIRQVLEGKRIVFLSLALVVRVMVVKANARDSYEKERERERSRGKKRNKVI